MNGVETCRRRCCWGDASRSDTKFKPGAQANPARLARTLLRIIIHNLKFYIPAAVLILPVHSVMPDFKSGICTGELQSS